MSASVVGTGDRADELDACRLLHLVYGGRCVVADRRGAPAGTPDLLLCANGRLVRVEVTSLTEPGRATTWGAVDLAPFDVPVPGDWWVWLAPDVGSKQQATLRGEPLIALLRQLVAMNVDNSRRLPLAEQRRLLPHGVTGALRIFHDPQPRGRARLQPPSTAAFDQDLDLAVFVEDAVARQDRKVTKLASASADERHLWLWVPIEGDQQTFLSLALGGRLRSRPQRPPRIPEALDAVWVATGVTYEDDGPTSPVFRWHRRLGWQRYSPITGIPITPWLRAPGPR